MKKTTYLVLAGMILFASCKEDQDDDAPQFDQVSINGVVIGVSAEGNAGETLTLEVSCTDNESLNQLKIDLHPNEDGHSHGDVGSSEASNGDWEEFEIIDLEGTSQTVSRSYTIPENARGEWHLGLSLIDERGNEATPKFIDLDLENSIIPEISILDFNGVDAATLVLEAGVILTINGTVADQSGLATVAILVEEEDGTELYTSSYDVAGATTFDLTTVSFETPTAIGETVDFSITATDSDGYSYTWSAELSYL
jgi:hypothetical protein